MHKSPEAFRTISEVAELLDTPAHVLRFWESRFPQIRPVKRAGGRRYYRPADVALLAGIRKLLHDDGVTIRGVQKILREQGIRHVSGLVEEFAARGDGPEPGFGALPAELDEPRGLSDWKGLVTPPERPVESAQIIPLDLALARAEGRLDLPPLISDPNLPEPPEGREAAQSRIWQQDPGDAGEVARAGDGRAAMDGRGDGVKPVEVEPGLFDADGAPFAGVGSGDEAATLATSDMEGPFETADTPTAEPATEGKLPDSPVEGTEEAEAATTGVDATLAALIRQAARNGNALDRARLIPICLRLVDLRERVSEAARRRAR